MLLASQWARSGLTPPVFVATVDHQLRAEARQEAETVAQWAQTLGLAHRLLSWEGAKPQSRLMEKARDARYALLCSFAHEVGADCLVTAHHADDQVETILFRLLRGSGLKGLGGMQAVTWRGSLRHVRPLLAWPKAALVGICEAAGHPYFEDPTNHNPAFARTRMRDLARVLADHGLTSEHVLKLGQRAAGADAALQARAQSLAATLLEEKFGEDGGFKIDISTLRAEPPEIFERVLEMKIQAVASKNGYWRLNRLEALAARIQDALLAQESCSASLGGTVLHLTARGTLSIRPERNRRRGRATVASLKLGKDKLTAL
jgi:tRNA(Ile)-lysidine synthase